MSSKQKDLPYKDGLEAARQRIESTPAPQKSQKKDDEDDLPEFRIVFTSEEEKAVADARTAKLETWVSNLIGAMTKYIKLLWIFLNGDEMHRAANLAKFREVKKEIENAFSVKNPLLHREAMDAYAVALVREAPETPWALQAVLHGPKVEDARLPGLIELGILKEGEKDKDVPMRIGKKYYAPIKNSTKSLKEIEAVLREKAVKVAEEGREWFEEKLESLKSQGKAIGGTELTPKKLVTGTPGWLVLNVPDQKLEDGRFLGGGFVLLLSDGKEVAVIDAIGHFQRKVLELRDAGRKLPVGILNQSFFDRNKLSFPPMDREKRNKVASDLWLLHSILRRGIVAAAVKEERQAANEEERRHLNSLADTDWTEWFLDNPPGATSYFNSHGWEVKQEDGTIRKYFPLHIVVERRADGEVRLKDYHPALKDLFGTNFSAWIDPKERFEGLQYPLREILRVAYSAARAVRNRKEREAAKTSASQSEVATSAEPTDNSADEQQS